MPIIHLDGFGGFADDAVARVFRRALRLRAAFPILKYDEEGALLLSIIWYDDTPAHNFLRQHSITADDLCQVFPIQYQKLDKNQRLPRTMPTGYVRLLRDCLDDYDSRFLTSEMLLSYLLSCQRTKDIFRLLELDASKLETELEASLGFGIDIDSTLDQQELPDVPDQSRKSSPFLAPFLIEFHGREPREMPSGNQPPASNTSAFLINLVERARQGKLLPLIERDAEIDRLITILARRTKNNPLLLGEAGVGKTAIVEGLALRIAEGTAPSFFLQKTIYQIDMTALLAGTTYRGQYEQRLGDVIKELETDPNAIAFIDELHTISSEGAAEHGTDAANILKPALARGELSLIGATTHAEFTKTIARDKALMRRFQAIFVSEPDKSATLGILLGLLPHYTEFHKVEIDPVLAERIVHLADAHIFDGRFPDKALDLLDEAASRAKMEPNPLDYSEQIDKYSREIRDWQSRSQLAAGHDDIQATANCKANISRLSQARARLEQKSRTLQTLTEDHVLYALSARTKVPFEKLKQGEKTGLLSLEQLLNQHLIGQEHVISEVASVIRRAKSGLADTNRPLGSFVFCGPTGVGKTELARILARELFGGEQHLIRFDMSEFSEAGSTAKLLGSPAGYVGYQDESGLDRIKKNPHSVILFDEFEKAHPHVWNVFLQILEQGTAQTARGELISFKNALVIMTSNLDSQSSGNPIGFTAEGAPPTKQLLSKKLRPELLNRFDKVLQFHPLSQKHAAQIFNLLFLALEQRLIAQGIKLSLSPAVRDYLINLGFSTKSGAREMRRVIERELEAPLANFLLAANQTTRDVKISLSNNQVICR